MVSWSPTRPAVRSGRAGGGARRCFFAFKVSSDQVSHGAPLPVLYRVTMAQQCLKPAEQVDHV
jgi:hypothetical protein